MLLPAPLRNALETELEGVSRTTLSERAARMSQAYRTTSTSAQTIRDDQDALAYAVTRMPATYAAVRHVLGRLQERCPQFEPASVADLGAGPGTASWAAVDAWPAIASITQVDHNPALMALGRELAASASPPLIDATYIGGDFAGQQNLDTGADLVLLSYAIAELAPTQIAAALARAWDQCTGAIVIVEPGTPTGYQRILHARGLLITKGARIVAPCPHELACPLAAPDWCHVAQRVPRTRDHRFVKSSALGYEDEKFSYLIAVRENLFAPPAANRILVRPSIGRAEAAFKLCCRDGSCGLVNITKRDPAAFKYAKKKEWGDEF